MKLVRGGDDAVAVYVSAGLGVPPIHPPYTAFGVQDDEGCLVGGILFNRYNGSNIEATVYGRACAQRKFLRAVLHYAFVELKCNRLSCRTKRSNKNVSRQLSRLGFTHEGTLKHYFGPNRGDDAILYALFPMDAARWIGEPDGN